MWMILECSEYTIYWAVRIISKQITVCDLITSFLFSFFLYNVRQEDFNFFFVTDKIRFIQCPLSLHKTQIRVRFLLLSKYIDWTTRDNKNIFFPFRMEDKGRKLVLYQYNTHYQSQVILDWIFSWFNQFLVHKFTGGLDYSLFVPHEFVVFFKDTIATNEFFLLYFFFAALVTIRQNYGLYSRFLFFVCMKIVEFEKNVGIDEY